MAVPVADDVKLLPTPTTVDMGIRKTPEQWDEWVDRMRDRHAGNNGNGHGRSLNIEVVRHRSERFGPYAAAIDAHTELVGRPAPEPTAISPRTGNHRMNPPFVEWMMCLPAGWVTDVPGLSFTAQMTALGNGVVPPQAEAALWHLLSTE